MWYGSDLDKDFPALIEGNPCVRPLVMAAYEVMKFTAQKTTIPTVVASPERVYAVFWEQFAQYKNQWIHKSLLTKEQLEESVVIVPQKNGTYPQLPVPIASLSQDGEPEFDPSRFSEVPLRKIRYSSDGRYALCSKHPTPIILRFVYDVKFDNIRDKDDFIAQLWVRFRNNMATVRVDYGEVWGVRNITAGDVTIADNSELEPGEGGRTIRKTVNFSIFGHILPEPKKVPTVREVRVSFRDLENGNEIDSLETQIQRR